MTPACSSVDTNSRALAAVIGTASFVASARRIVLVASPVTSTSSDTDQFSNPLAARNWGPVRGPA